MDLGELRELSKQKIELQPRIDERKKQGSEISTVIEALETKNGEGREVVEVVMSEPFEDGKQRNVELVANIYEFAGDALTTIRFIHRPTGGHRSVYYTSDDVVGVFPNKTEKGDYNDPVHLLSGEIGFRLPDEELDELHSIVMTIGEVASDPELNPYTAKMMTGVMQEIQGERELAELQTELYN